MLNINGPLGPLMPGPFMQRQSKRNKPISDASSVARRFSQLMMSGKVKAALYLCLLSSDCDGKVLPFHSEGDVVESLVKKHPKKRPPVSSTLVDDC